MSDFDLKVPNHNILWFGTLNFLVKKIAKLKKLRDLRVDFFENAAYPEVN
jgi:hypothetical protein